jgi:gas vesicle protein
MRHDEGGHGTGSLIFSFVLGGLAGAGLALLFAPLSGRETREKISDFAEDVKDRAECYVDEAKYKVRSTVQRGKEFAEEKKSAITSAIEAGKEAYEKEKEKHAKGA